MDGVRGNASGAGVAVALLFIAFCLFVMAARGTYFDVWRAFNGTPTPTASNGGGSAGGF